MFSRVYVEITNICNMHCSCCHGHHRPPRQMTEAEYARGYETLERERKKADTYLRAVFTKTERTVLCD